MTCTCFVCVLSARFSLELSEWGQVWRWGREQERLGRMVLRGEGRLGGWSMAVMEAGGGRSAPRQEEAVFRNGGKGAASGWWADGTAAGSPPAEGGGGGWWWWGGRCRRGGRRSRGWWRARQSRVRVAGKKDVNAATYKVGGGG
jgi:hypothetical protein